MPMPGYVFKDGGPIPDSELKERENSSLNIEAAQSQHLGATTSPRRPSTSNSSTAFDTPTSSTSLLTTNNNNDAHPTESHALANADHAVRGASQLSNSATDGDGEGEEDEVRNLGWFEHPNDIPPLVGGLPNEELWTLIRRFNKQMYHVKATTDQPPGGLDLYIVDEDEFSPDKLRSNVERLYMTVIIGLMGLGKHVARLRSWREPRRTGAFCAVSDHSWG